jgi:hypothetical protein
MFHIFFWKKTYCITLVVWMNSNGSIAQHGFNTGSSNDNTFIRALDRVSKGNDDTKLVLFLWIVIWDRQQGATFQLLILNLKQELYSKNQFIKEGVLVVSLPLDLKAQCAVWYTS